MLESFKNLVGKKTKEDVQVKAYASILEKNPNNLNIRLKLGDLYAKLGTMQPQFRNIRLRPYSSLMKATLSKPLRSIKLLSDWIRPDKKPWTDCQISIFNAASLLIHW
jgi:hypothetical protein